MPHSSHVHVSGLLDDVIIDWKAVEDDVVSIRQQEIVRRVGAGKGAKGY